jgi:hypothetical protein
MLLRSNVETLAEPPIKTVVPATIARVSTNVAFEGEI